MRNVEVPLVRVGIMHGREIEVTFCNRFVSSDGREMFGRHTFHPQDGSRIFRPADGCGSFVLHGVTIGKQFHWERHQDQTFEGVLELIAEGDGLWAVNHIDVESYLLSVISSEMNEQSSYELLKVHSIISRSWLLAQMQHKACGYEGECRESEGEIVRWFDHDSHTLFDVCADDHCQRYQGRGFRNVAVGEAVADTSGMVLTYDGEICDARFSKCCGGVTEVFSTCWQPVEVAYLKAFRDAGGSLPVPDLTRESGARSWILSHPDAFCSNPSAELLGRVLNDYDLEDRDFYRWRVSYTADQLAALVADRLGRSLGLIKALRPLHRGPSGRIDRLEIVGTAGRIIVGKELVIRRVLSTSHLKSSAFVVETEGEMAPGVPTQWTLRGAGWGHGVGLCQIGAAVMADRGYKYGEILNHYFPGAMITRLY